MLDGAVKILFGLDRAHYADIENEASIFWCNDIGRGSHNIEWKTQVIKLWFYKKNYIYICECMGGGGCNKTLIVGFSEWL